MHHWFANNIKKKSIKKHKNLFTGRFSVWIQLDYLGTKA